MSRGTTIRTARGLTAATLGFVLVASIGTAQAAPAALTPDVSAVAQVPAAPAAAPTVGLAASPIAAAVPRVSRATALRAARVARLSKFTTFTLRSAATKDMRGVERSLYHGKYYRPAVEGKRLCIAHRESEGHYDVVSSSGSYYGAYQVSRALARGATWMMLREHKELMGAKAATTTLAKLRATPMNRWPRYWQDAAFSTVMNWEGTGSGASHWAGGRWHC